MKFRLARHTTDLDTIKAFYTLIPGMKILGEFKDHNTYNGIFIGIPETGWHLEFTTSEEAPGHHPDKDDLLVFYAASMEQYDEIRSIFKSHHIAEQIPKNLYWKQHGAMYIDPDGFGIVIALPAG